MNLVELDLTKQSFRKGSQKEGLENTNDHPDIKQNTFYLCKIDGNYYAGKFLRTWFGLSFTGHYTYQYDKPNTNHSQWENIWEIVN